MSQRNERARFARSVMELIDTGHREISRHLDLTRVRILGVVAARGPVRPSEIAAALGLTKSAVSRHLTALQQAGRIAVDDDPVDARTFLVRVTDAGTGDQETTLHAGTIAFTRVIADWSDEDVRTARVLVDRLLTAWAQAGDRPAASGPGWRKRTATPEEDA